MHNKSSSTRILLIGWCLLLFASVAFSQDLSSLPFAGKYRVEAKTSIVRENGQIKKPKSHASLESLLQSLKHEEEMRAYYPTLADKKSTLARKNEENENVEVVAWIWAIKFDGGKGGSYDFQVIAGTSDNGNKARFFNIKVSGLPEKGSMDYDTLRTVRKKFMELFSDIGTGETKFVQVEPARKVKITGSLFCDAASEAGCEKCPGPSWAKPKTVWEIRPVYGINAE
jgi:hypothetical protein